jgi:hypothetical protein
MNKGRRQKKKKQEANQASPPCPGQEMRSNQIWRRARVPMDSILPVSHGTDLQDDNEALVLPHLASSANNIKGQHILLH